MQKNKQAGEEQLKYWYKRAQESKLTAMVKAMATEMTSTSIYYSWECMMRLYGRSEYMVLPTRKAEEPNLYVFMQKREL